MKKILIIILILSSFNSLAKGNKEKKQDIQAIKGMCGCMNIKFDLLKQSPNKDL